MENYSFYNKKIKIQLAVSLTTININDIAYEEFNNVSVYDIIRDKLLKNNDIIIFLSVFTDGYRD